MDIFSFLGIFLAIIAILSGQYLEGGHLTSLINAPAAIIVLGGTLGAVMLQSPARIFLRAIKMLFWIFIPPKLSIDATIAKIITWSDSVRRDGLLSLENEVEIEDNLFARKGLQLLVDGNEPEVIRKVLEVELDSKANLDRQAAKVFEAMGGYSPTIGIIGAVMGLIHVMENLSDPGKLGGGIAVAFVATIYGVGCANLLFIPIANKLKSLVIHETQYREMIIEGIVSISEGEYKNSMESKLQGFFD